MVEDAVGLTVLFVHGFLDDAATWDDVVADLNTPDLVTVRVDLAGMCGRPDAPGPYTVARYADDVTAAVDTTTGEVVLVGQSMGGPIVELTAVARRDRVAGLVLVTPVPLGGTNLPEEAVAPLAALGGHPDAQRQARLENSVAFPGEELDRLTRAGARVTLEATTEAVASWNAGHPLGAVPSHFHGPVLLVRGAQDTFAGEEMVASIAGRFTDATLAIVGQAGHWLHVEQPAALARLLDSFLAERIRGRAQANTTSGVLEQGWTTAFASKSADAFGDTFASDVALEASTLNWPVEGRENVKRVMAAASSIYESLTFVHETTNGLRTYLEWEATLPGGAPVDGVTVLTKNEKGHIVRVAIHHRPLQAVLAFSRELGERVGQALGQRGLIQH